MKVVQVSSPEEALCQGMLLFRASLYVTAADYTEYCLELAARPTPTTPAPRQHNR